jgi:hypothetical protein
MAAGSLNAERLMRVARCIGSVIDVSAITRRYAMSPLGNVQRNLQRSLLDATTLRILSRSTSFQGGQERYLLTGRIFKINDIQDPRLRQVLRAFSMTVTAAFARMPVNSTEVAATRYAGTLHRAFVNH